MSSSGSGAPSYAKKAGPHHGMAPMRGIEQFTGVKAPVGAGRFGRIFPRSSYNPTDDAIHALAQTMEETNTPDNDNPEIPIGITFLGQFIDHDLTLDATTLFGQQQDPNAVTDFRTPNFDLDNLYGAGPGVSRFLYDVRMPDTDNPVKLLLDDGRDFDLPRNSLNTALIGDLRNDENFLVSQLHRAFMKFHNAVVDLLRSTNPSKYSGLNGNTDLFKDASQTVRWHYQWIVFHEFLPTILENDVLNDVIKSGRKLYLWNKQSKYPFMPVEFSTAAYRLGHSMLRQNYKLNATREADLFNLPVFGNPRIDASYKLDFKLFFDYPGQPKAQRARKIDAKVTMPVFQLPFIDPKQDPPISLPERNMQRAKIFGVPSGQEVAQDMVQRGINIPRVYSNADLGIDEIAGLQDQAPLWFYILKESEFNPTNSLRLGPVGSRLVAEVFLGLLSDIPGNYLHDDPGFKPTLPSAKPGEFTMLDLLAFAKA
ncbi:MAG TPA: heme peroxidase family protein [Bryobacteraceae bacterium]|nr:heme peroxidase family protein [Bryobacteraceae bacterium]